MPTRHVAFCFMLALGMAVGARGVSAERPPRPDVLLIMPDQMRGDCLSMLGHPVVKTPQLDKLARQGVLFRRAYTTVPSCIPARYALLTGLYPQTSGVVGFRSPPIRFPTMPQLLAAAGYTTALVGRNMHQTPPDEPYGYQQWIRASTHVEGDEYNVHLSEAAPEVGRIREWVGKLGLTYNGWEARAWPLADDLHPTAWVVAQSRRVVAQSPADRPLLLTTSFFAPHPPLFPPKRHFDSCLQRSLPSPARGGWVDYSAVPDAAKAKKQSHRVLLEGETLRTAQAGYFGLIEHVDEQIAPLIEEFKARSEKAGRPWLIVFTTDHGEMLGDHGYFRKCEPYEGSANIPFIITGSPELGFRAGSRCLQPVCLEDIMPTLLQLAGAERPKPMDGVSLVPVLRGEDQAIRPWLHFEHATCYSQDQAFHALTDGRFKYVWRPLDGAEQLFDLNQDLREEHDLSKDPAHAKTLNRWRRTLIERLAKRPEGFSDGQRLIPGRPYPPLQRRAMPDERSPSPLKTSRVPPLPTATFSIVTGEPYGTTATHARGRYAKLPE